MVQGHSGLNAKSQQLIDNFSIVSHASGIDGPIAVGKNACPSNRKSVALCMDPLCQSEVLLKTVIKVARFIPWQQFSSEQFLKSG